MILLILVIILLIVGIVIAVQNADLAMFDILFWNFEWPLAFLLLLFFAIGLVVGLVAVIPHIIKKHRHVRDERKKVSGLQKEINEKEEKLRREVLNNRESNIMDV